MPSSTRSCSALPVPESNCEVATRGLPPSPEAASCGAIARVWLPRRAMNTASMPPSRVATDCSSGVMSAGSSLTTASVCTTLPPCVASWVAKALALRRA